ncbi:hypothetical protein LIPSTDRAFT_333552 [Lipomyces starkeyi NRRL Y-11557]|uniref:DDE-1 domain-containing protein n=1 Tax=Lipomyces starkeyi NRRL Y-11557 TaxID=675824 RepID=A0A1E3PY76_LIPST|nr:hypothetical protein LIPSTDRAFT_333552 [Lipomyces starkeyi NRRL Y-11557]
MTKYGIGEDDVYNFDEIGYMMSIISTGMVVTSYQRRGRPRMAQQGNKEWVTVIRGINSRGSTIPPYIIVAAKITFLLGMKTAQYLTTG